MKKDKRRGNSILALIMSFAVIISGFGTPGISLAFAAGDESAPAAEKTAETRAPEKVQVEASNEKTVNAEEKEEWLKSPNPDI
ncbi:hypothetical protein [Mogibacterium timidum]|uniref:hypothetical protein n=1 Tax=Mogibacterium timidum TaxID=35519 RepID=UPI0028DB39B6|nr:hypothetical protein [Mogibacterium timidum]